MPWTFSMEPVEVGRLLLSAWQDCLLQRRHCRTKDWPYSQAAGQVRIMFIFELLILQDGVMWESGGGMCCAE